MPRRPSPSSLKSNCLTAVAKNLELLSYGCEKGSAELRDLIDTEYFLQIKGDLKGDSFLCYKTLMHHYELYDSNISSYMLRTSIPLF